jgi:hypothetical protein
MVGRGCGGSAIATTGAATTGLAPRDDGGGGGGARGSERTAGDGPLEGPGVEVGAEGAFFIEAPHTAQ